MPVTTQTKPGMPINNKGRFSATSQRTYPSTEKPCEVGVLVEVPVMLTLVKIANNTKGWFNKEVPEEYGLDS